MAKDGGDGFVRADQIDLKELDAQLERHLSRAWTMEKEKVVEKSITERKPREDWEIDPAKLIIKSVIARGTFGTVHRGIYDGQDVAANYLRTALELGLVKCEISDASCHLLDKKLRFLASRIFWVLNKSLEIFNATISYAVKLLDWGEEGSRSETEIASLRSAFTQEVGVWHQLDHPNVTKVCPICSIKVPRDMLNHIMLQHSYMLRHRMHRVAISSSQTLSILGYELGDSYLPVLGGDGRGGHQLSGIHNASGASSSLNDAFLSISTLLLNVASPETEEVSKAIVPSLDDCLRKSSTSSHLWKLRIDSSTSSEEREVKVRQATVRASFVQDLLLCTLFE